MGLKKINKKNSVNNIISFPKVSGDVELKEANSKNVLSSFYFNPKINPQVTKKFIKTTEGLIRRSVAYSNYISYLANNFNLTNDAINGNIDNEMATLEFHHYPFTLYDITEIVLNSHIMNSEDDMKVTSISLAEEVMQLHYQNLIGLVRLSKTNHELVHAGKLFVPLSAVFGRVNTFTERYKEYMFADQIDKFNQLVEYGRENDIGLTIDDDKLKLVNSDSSTDNPVFDPEDEEDPNLDPNNPFLASEPNKD